MCVERATVHHPHMTSVILTVVVCATIGIAHNGVARAGTVTVCHVAGTTVVVEVMHSTTRLTVSDATEHQGPVRAGTVTTTGTVT